jgi:hypothetical protein
MAIMAELQELANSVKNYREGSIVKGHILEIRPRNFWWISVTQERRGDPGELETLDVEVGDD